MLTPDEMLRISGLKNEIYPCGSRITNPDSIREDSDWDYLVSAGVGMDLSDKERNLSDLVASLCDDNWELESGEGGHYQSQAADRFLSMRKGDNNLIITTSEQFVWRHSVATHVCKSLCLTDKQERIMVFQAILYNNIYQVF